MWQNVPEKMLGNSIFSLFSPLYVWMVLFKVSTDILNFAIVSHVAIIYLFSYKSLF